MHKNKHSDEPTGHGNRPTNQASHTKESSFHQTTKHKRPSSISTRLSDFLLQLPLNQSSNGPDGSAPRVYLFGGGKVLHVPVSELLQATAFF